MPEMDGLSFLAKVRDLKPEVPRVMLTGYADKENAIKAINEVGLYQYIEKPWNNDDLCLVLRNGIEKKKLFERLQQKMAANSSLLWGITDGCVNRFTVAGEILP